jgi:2-polyprenyl-3-methyl-5-hydroxy-6-metoxy-1,4-benzoquinol methylase
MQRQSAAGARLLDVGCSTGDYLDRALARGWTISGIDVAKHLVAFARIKRRLPVEHGRAVIAARCSLRVFSQRV